MSVLRNQSIWSFIAGFALIGIIFAAVSLASSQPSGIEAEDASLAGSASLEFSSGASGGSFVEVGQQAGISGFGSRCRAIKLSRTAQSNVLQVDAEFIKEGVIDNVTIEAFRYTLEEDFSRSPSVQVSPSDFPIEYALSPQEFGPGTYWLNIKIPGNSMSSGCSSHFEVGTNISAELPQISCTVAHRLVSQPSTYEFLFESGSLNTSIDRAYLLPGDGSYLSVSLPSGEIRSRVFTHTYPIRQAPEYYTLTSGLSGFSLEGGPIGLKDKCNFFTSQTIDVAPPQNNEFAPPTGISLIDAKPYVDQLSPGTSVERTLEVLNSYFEETYFQASVKGLNPVSKIEVSINRGGSTSRPTTPINPSLPSHQEKMRIAAHAFLDNWSRMPLEISSAIGLDHYVFFYAIEGAPATAPVRGGIHYNVYGIAANGFNEDTGQVGLAYNLLSRIIAHEYGHTYHQHYLEGLFGQDLPAPGGYAAFDQANPDWFTSYGDSSILRLDPAGNPQGFWRDHSTTNQWEDIADVFTPFFAKGMRTEAQNRTTGPDADPNLQAKFNETHQRLLELEPDLTDENLERLHSLPSYLPTP